MTIVPTITKKLLMTNIILDKKQTLLKESFQKLADSLASKSFIKNIINKLCGAKGPSGVYLHGSVGRGKTMLMQMFYEMLSVSKEIIHFQSFMQEVHQKLHKFQLSRGADKVIKKLAEEISDRVEVLCIDEFEVKDITDAMIVMRLFSFLSKAGVFIFVTTNTLPDELYKDGLQRESFLPFIANVKKNFIIFNLDSDKDYRLQKASSLEKKIFFPLNESTKTILQNIKDNLCSREELYPGKFEVFGREVIFAKTHQNILFTNFDELFTQDFGYADYVNLCQRFQVIVLEDVRQISEDETDIITRFINFIDNAYFYKILLFASLESEPSELYSGGKRLAEFKRTVSRLYEQNW
jgi:cell division protein ZapE